MDYGSVGYTGVKESPLYLGINERRLSYTLELGQRFHS